MKSVGQCLRVDLETGTRTFDCIVPRLRVTYRRRVQSTCLRESTSTRQATLQVAHQLSCGPSFLLSRRHQKPDAPLFLLVSKHPIILPSLSPTCLTASSLNLDHPHHRTISAMSGGYEVDYDSDCDVYDYDDDYIYADAGAYDLAVCRI